jgi:hypothetical protein
MGVNKEEIGTQELNLEEYAAILEEQDLSEDKGKHLRDLNHIVELAEDTRNPEESPRQVAWRKDDKDKLEANLGRLVELNEMLYEMLGYSGAEIAKATLQSGLAILQLMKPVQKTRELPIAGAKGLGSSADGTENVFSKGATPVEDDLFDSLSKIKGNLRKLLRFRIVIAESESREHPNWIWWLRHTELQYEREQIEEDQEQRTLAKYKNGMVWVEWQMDTGVFEPSPERLRSIELLVTQLRLKDKPAEVRVPNCLGYIVDDREYYSLGLVFEIPNARNSTTPRSLFQFLKGKAKPPIASRVNLAQKLATSLLYLHAVDLLHTHLRSACILFFTEQIDATDELYGPGVNISEPYIGGFRCFSKSDFKSRMWAEGKDGDCASGIYEFYGRSPKIFDIHSLGIILLEIAYWKPAREIFNIKRYPDRGSMQIRELFPKYETHLLRRVRWTMGNRYHDAVRACLEGFWLPPQFDEHSPVGGALVQQAYMSLVVENLDGVTL